MYTVSTLAKATGLNVDTIRYYARLGLIREASRSRGGHRFFDDHALERIRFIRGAQWFDLRLDEIRELLDVSDSGGCACGLTQSLLEQKITAIDAQRERLDRVRAALAGLLDNVGAPGFNAAAMSVASSAGTGEPAFSEREILERRREAINRRLQEVQAS